MNLASKWDELTQEQRQQLFRVFAFASISGRPTALAELPFTNLERARQMVIRAIRWVEVYNWECGVSAKDMHRLLSILSRKHPRMFKKEHIFRKLG